MQELLNYKKVLCLNRFSYKYLAQYQKKMLKIFGLSWVYKKIDDVIENLPVKIFKIPTNLNRIIKKWYEKLLGWYDNVTM